LVDGLGARLDRAATGHLQRPDRSTQQRHAGRGQRRPPATYWRAPTGRRVISAWRRFA
jgi:hypothetical protein